MNLTLSHAFVTVSDHEEALSFYRDALGLEVRTDVGKGKMRWITLSPRSQPEVEVVLNPTHAGRSPTATRSLHFSPRVH